MRRVLIGGFAALALAVTGACAEDGDVDNVADGSGSVEEYCAMSAELDAADAPPSEEQLDEIVEVAPAEIKDDVRTLADSIREQDYEAEAAQEADRNLQEWEAEHCDRPAGDAGTDGGTDGTGTDGGTEVTEADRPGGGTDGPGTGNDGTGGEGPSSGEPGEAGGDEGDTPR